MPLNHWKKDRSPSSKSQLDTLKLSYFSKHKNRKDLKQINKQERNVTNKKAKKKRKLHL